MAGFEDKDGNSLAVQINVTRSFAEGNGATLVTTVPQTAAVKDIASVVDMLMFTMGRMEAHARISAISNDLEANAARIAQQEVQLAEFRKRHPDEGKMNTPDRTTLQTCENTLSLSTKLAASLRDERERLEKGLK